MFPVIEFYTEFIWGQEVTQQEVYDYCSCVHFSVFKLLNKKIVYYDLKRKVVLTVKNIFFSSLFYSQVTTSHCSNCAQGLLYIIDLDPSFREGSGPGSDGGTTGTFKLT